LQETSQAAFDAEDAYQRQLAKKLGIKGKKKKAEARTEEALDQLDSLFAGELLIFRSSLFYAQVMAIGTWCTDNLHHAGHASPTLGFLRKVSSNHSGPWLTVRGMLLQRTVTGWHRREGWGRSHLKVTLFFLRV
jgi:hypothetical protein